MICKKCNSRDIVFIDKVRLFCNGCSSELSDDNLIFRDKLNDFSEGDLTRDFYVIIKENTREEFNNKYNIVKTKNSVVFKSKNGVTLNLGCPYFKVCDDGDDCLNCWKDVVAQVKFKDEG